MHDAGLKRKEESVKSQWNADVLRTYTDVSITTDLLFKFVI